MGRKVNNWSASSEHIFMNATKVIGYYPDGDVWIFNNNVQIDRQGRQLPSEVNSVYYIPHKDRRIEANIHIPLSTTFLDEALNKLETLASHNFMPCVYGLGAQAMLTNAPHIIRIFDTCAPVCLVGPSGRGKTLTMKMAQAMVGMQEIGLMKSAKRETVIALACKSTLGVWIDDPQQLHPELVVDFYNLSRQETISRGSEEIRSGLMFTSNNFLKGTSERENRRILYIKYAGEPITPKNPTERQQQVALKKLIDGPLSATAGEIVRIGAEFQETGFLEVINKWEPFVLEATNGLTGDLGLHYAILHWFTRKMFEAVGRDPNSVDKFFIERLAGTISTLQPTTSREEVNRAPPQLPLLDHFRKDIVDTVTSLPEEQLKNMFQIGSYIQNFTSVDAVVVHRDFYLGKPYTSKTVHSCLKGSGEGLGKSQSRQWNGVSTPTTLVAQSSFDKDEMIKIKTAMGNLKKASNQQPKAPTEIMPTSRTASPTSTGASPSTSAISPLTMESESNIMASIPASTSPTTTSRALSKYVTNVNSCSTPKPVSRVSISNLLQRFSKPAPEAEDTVTVIKETNPLPINQCNNSKEKLSKPAPEAEDTVTVIKETNPLPINQCNNSKEKLSKPAPEAEDTVTVIKETNPLPINQCNNSKEKLSKPAPEAEDTVTVIKETIPLPNNQCHRSPLWEDDANRSARSLEAVGLIPVDTCNQMLEEQKGKKRRLRAPKAKQITTVKKSRRKAKEQN